MTAENDRLRDVALALVDAILQRVGIHMATHPYCRERELPFAINVIDGAFLFALKTTTDDGERSFLEVNYARMGDYLLSDEEYVVFDKWRRFQRERRNSPPPADAVAFARELEDATSGGRATKIDRMLAERMRERWRIVDSLRE